MKFYCDFRCPSCNEFFGVYFGWDDTVTCPKCNEKYKPYPEDEDDEGEIFWALDTVEEPEQ